MLGRYQFLLTSCQEYVRNGLTRRCSRQMRRGSRLVEPDRIQAHDVEDTEIRGRVETLDVTVPDLVDPFPGDRQQGWVLLHDGFGLVDQWQTLGGIDFPVDLRGQRLELLLARPSEPLRLRARETPLRDGRSPLGQPYPLPASHGPSTSRV